MSDSSQESLRFRVEIPSDGMSAWLRVDPGCPAEDIQPDVVAALLTSREVRLDKQAEFRLAKFIESYKPENAPKEGARCQLVVGQEPVHGTDGYFETEEQLSTKGKSQSAANQAAPTDDGCKTSAVDHYSRTAFRVVPKDHVIGTIRPPTSGQDGIDVRGKIVPACPGKSCPITAGPGTELLPDGRILSTISGQLKLVGNAVRVESRLQITENVDFSVGHVDFPGDVAVGQGVRDRFRVHAGGSLKIGGLVEAARVEADTDVILAGGIAGRDRGVVRAGRDAIVRYADSSRVIAGRNLHVQKELNDCNVLVRGNLEGEQCKVCGGTLWLISGGKVAAIGSAGGVETNVIVGRIGPLDVLLQRINSELLALGKHEAACAQTFDSLKSHPSRGDQHVVERLMMAQMQLSEARNRQGRLLEAQKRVKASAAKFAEADLQIRSRLFHGVRIWIGEESLVVKTDLKGPLRIWADTAGQAFITDGVDGSTRRAEEILEADHAAVMPPWIDVNDEREADDESEEQQQQPQGRAKRGAGGGSGGGGAGAGSNAGGKSTPSRNQSSRAA